jgi:Sulfotransferase family
MSYMATVWNTVDADLAAANVGRDPGPREAPPVAVGDAGDNDGRDPQPEKPTQGVPSDLPEPAKAWIRETSHGLMRRYCDRGGKRLYVDKSLDSVYYLELVRALYPEVRCLLAVRHVMDTIASGLEASPWGFQGYGYAPYVNATPGNFVAALANYWLDHVTQALEWEKEHQDLCMRVRYEDLVTDPAGSVTEVQHFLRVTTDLTVLNSAFERDVLFGPGDYKVEHTTAVHARSVGRGKRIPISMFPPRLLEAVNEKLVELNYPALDASWNTAERTVDHVEGTIWSNRLEALMDNARSSFSDMKPVSFAVVAEDHSGLRWVIDPRFGKFTRGDGDVDAVITGTAEDLVLLLTKEENLGVLLRSGRIRHVIADDEVRAHIPGEVRAIVRFLKSAVNVDVR